ncbi:hypothetical protein [Cellulomonas sp. Marseille-Q8402]
MTDDRAVVEVHSDYEAGKAIYWFTCSCGHVSDDDDAQWLAQRSSMKHRREQHA